MSDWTFHGKPFDDDDIPEWAVGFVYLITRTDTGRKYIGKKLFKRKTKLYRKSRNKRVTRPSNWKRYFGSCQALKDDVAALGEVAFTREILELCPSKGDLSLTEMREQIVRDVLHRDDFYNDFIGGKIHRKHLKSS